MHMTQRSPFSRFSKNKISIESSVMTDTKENTIDKTQVIKKIHDLFSKDQFSAAVERLKLLGPDFDCKDGKRCL